MSELMPIEQAEFIDELQRWFHESTNMCHEDCYRFAFVIWQHKDKLSQMFGYQQGRADAIDDCKMIIQAKIIDALSLENATKYGNKNAKQTEISYGTLMRYEIADCVEDLLDELEQLKEHK